MSPRLNKKFSPGAEKKFSSIELTQDTSFFNLNLYSWKPLIDGDGDENNQGGITVTEFQNVLNVTVNDGVSTIFEVPLIPNDRIPTDNGIIKCKLLGAGEKPLEGQVKGNNTLSWLETIETLEIEVNAVYNPSNLLDIFSFEDIRENVVDVEGRKITRTKIFYVSAAEPITDNLTSGNPVVATKLTLTSGITSLLQNPDNGGLLEVEYLVEPVKPANAAYAVVTYSSYMIHNAIGLIDDSGIPLSTQRISELNKDDFGNNELDFNKDYLISDDFIIDGVYPKTITQKKVSMHSWMSGEIWNKIRIWNDSNSSNVGKNGYFGQGVRKKSNADGEIRFTNSFTDFYGLIPNTYYVWFTPGTAPVEFDNEILESLGKDGNNDNAVTPWYNSFSFFENIFYSKPTSQDIGNAKWKTSNSFFTFDVERAEVMNLQEGLVMQDPNVNIKNPNYSEEDYDNFVNQAVTGSVTINGTTFNLWDNPFTQIDKDDNLYEWTNNENDLKFIGCTPGNDYYERMNKIISSGGKLSADNSAAVKVGKTQIVEAKQKFPVGDGSKQFIYPNEIFFSEQYCKNNGWRTNNKLVVKLNQETTLSETTIDVWGGEKIKVEYFDSKGYPAIGLDQDGNELVLPPTTLPAPNQDSSGNPLKTRVRIIYGFTLSSRR